MFDFLNFHPAYPLFLLSQDNDSVQKHKMALLKFDFEKVPEEVDYIFTGSPQGGSWTALISDNQVVEKTRDEWFDVFEAITVARPQHRF